MQNDQTKSTLSVTSAVTLCLKYTGNFISPVASTSISPSPISSSSRPYCRLSTRTSTVCIVSATGVADTVVFHRTEFPSNFFMGVLSRCPFRELQLPVRYKSFSLPAAFIQAHTIVNWIFLFQLSGQRLTDSLAIGALGTIGFYWATSISSSSSSRVSSFTSSLLSFSTFPSMFCSLLVGQSSSRFSSFTATLSYSSSFCLRSEVLLSLGKCSLVGASEPFSADCLGLNLTSQISLMSAMSLERECALLGSLSTLRRGTFCVTVPYCEFTISSQISLNQCTLALISSSQSSGSSQVVRSLKLGCGQASSMISLTAYGFSLRLTMLRSCWHRGTCMRMSSAHQSSLSECRSLPSWRQKRAFKMCASGLLSAYLMARCKSSSRRELRARRRCRHERLAQRLSKAGRVCPALNCSEKRLKQATQLRWLRLIASVKSCTAASRLPSCEWNKALFEQRAELCGDLAMHCDISSRPFSYLLSQKWLDAKRNSYSTYIDIIIIEAFQAAKRIHSRQTSAKPIVMREGTELKEWHCLGMHIGR